MGPRLLGTFVGRRVSMRGFIVWDFNGEVWAALRQMGEWIRSGRIKFKEDIVEGIDKAPRAFIGLLRGENFGKLQVKRYGPIPARGRFPPEAPPSAATGRGHRGARVRLANASLFHVKQSDVQY